MTSEHSNARGVSAKAVSSREQWQREKKRRTRARIQESAIRLFLAHGYDDVTVQRIADAAGVTPITLFRYFPRKEDIVIDMPQGDELATALATIRNGSPAATTPSDMAAGVVDAIVSRFDDARYDSLARRLTIINGTDTLRSALFSRIPQWSAALADMFPPDDDDAEGFATRLGYTVAVNALIEIFGEWIRCRAHATIPDADALTQIAAEARNAIA
ncbi:TetR family transcriptional regulator [Bifidobacterium sp. 82T24]|uniref:TetR/AcrR family transcriptional regulator n=1 Tax=Bifidobacterium pluvialisilvae TaxID=2834436 RepID=UPI001C5A2C23|nr:TetR/AcrR family transcriptional regulator [Bifidobacterium pluvialisilvae]MBW3088245.1 TetR family transcriptional regulator [Bifidobacterium pluvialisilvae]